MYHHPGFGVAGWIYLLLLPFAIFYAFITKKKRKEKQALIKEEGK